jgi:hypothetical protein
VADDGNLGEVSQAFSSASCGSAQGDRYYTQDIANPACYSPTTYNSCTKGYIVDIDYLDAAYAGTGDTDANFSITWNDEVPTTQAACEALWGRAIIYKKVSGVYVDQTGNIDSYGTWFGNLGCTPPAMTSAGHVVLEALGSYRVAATMRTAYAGNWTRSLKVETEPAVHLH